MTQSTVPVTILKGHGLQGKIMKYYTKLNGLYYFFVEILGNVILVSTSE